MNNETQHTPGPWRLVYNENDELELGGGIEQSTGVYSAAGFGLVANVVYKKTNILGDSKKLQYETFKANAELIASAPSLLKENQELRNDLYNANCNHSRLDAEHILLKKENQELKEENERLIRALEAVYGDIDLDKHGSSELNFIVQQALSKSKTEKP
jgi:hypothetical protein